MKLESKSAKLFDAIIQLQLLLIIGLVYFAWFWWLTNAKPTLLEIKKEVETNSQRIDQINATLEALQGIENATLEAIRQRMGDDKLWQEVEKSLKPSIER